MIIVGIDFGDARTGLAVCDRYEMMASEAGCVAADSYKKTLEAVAEAVKNLHAERIVVGNPKNMNGTEGSRSAKCQAFARELAEATGIEVVLSARLILEDYLTWKKRHEGNGGDGRF